MPDLTLPDLIDPFYAKVGANYRNAFVRGQICWTHVSYAQENLQLWRPQGYTVAATAATTFGITPAGGDAFHRGLPLATPKLETNEEFVVVRAKQRPVILMAPAPADPGVPRGRGRGPVYRPLATVIPVFSLQDQQGVFKYPLDFIERVQKLMYPEYLYLPADGAVITRPSFAKICDIVSVYQPHLDPRDLRLSDDVLGVARGQVSSLQTGAAEGDFGLYRSELMDQKPRR